MIFGVGIDVIEIDRIAAAIERYGQRFLDRIFSPAEQWYCLWWRSPYEHFAARFAAKEAFSKAIGTGWRRQFIWREVSIERRPGEQPYIVLYGKMKQRWGHLRYTVSLSHNRSVAEAMVIAEYPPVDTLRQ